MKGALIAWALTGSLAHAAPALAPTGAAPIQFLYDARAVYPLVAAPGRITDIVLEPGESLVPTNAIAAGDTVRWIIGDTTSGEGASRRVHVLVKPTGEALSTNLVINTNRRTYLLDLRASGQAFVVQASWRYPSPAPPLPVVPAPPVSRPAAAPTGPAIDFGYRIEGRGALRPDSVWDDGARTFFAFPAPPDARALPPLFRTGEDGKAAELINYRVEGRTLVVDGLIDRVEFRMGKGRWAQSVRIRRRMSQVGGGR